MTITRNQTDAAAEGAPPLRGFGGVFRRAARTALRLSFIVACIIIGGSIFGTILHETGLSRGDFTLMAGGLISCVLLIMAKDMLRPGKQ